MSENENPTHVSDDCPWCPDCGMPRHWEVLPGGGVNAWCPNCGRRGAYDNVLGFQRGMLMDSFPCVYEQAPEDEGSCYECRTNTLLLADAGHSPLDGNANYVCPLHLDGDAVIFRRAGGLLGVSIESA